MLEAVTKQLNLNLYAFLCQQRHLGKHQLLARVWAGASGLSVIASWQVLYAMISSDKCAPMEEGHILVRRCEKNSSQYPLAILTLGSGVAKTLWKSEGSLFLQRSDLAKLGLDPLSMLAGVSRCTRAIPPHPGGTVAL